MNEITPQVLIVGAGGAGLTASLLLADLGIEALTIERHPDTSFLPKAHILNPRTMEIFERHGLAREVYAEGTPEENFQSTSWYTSLGGENPGDGLMFHRTDAWGGGAQKPRYAEISACRAGNMPQHELEPLLRRHAEERAPGSVRFNTELVSFEQDDEGVSTLVRDRESGEETRVRAAYMIAADGGKTVGPALGIEMEGPEPFVYMISIQVRADLSPYLVDDDSVVRLIARPLPDGSWIRGGLVCMGPKRWDRHAEVWRVSVMLPIAQAHPEDYDEERARADVRRQLGLPDLEMEVEVISPWLQESVLAARYQEGRIFLAGDAAHKHSPMGGLGLNTAVQDVHNLCWKLNAVLGGAAEPALLDSYEPERRPVARRNVEWATLNFFNHLASGSGFGLLPGAPEEHNRRVMEMLFAATPDGAARRARLSEFYETSRAEFIELDVELGFEYAESPAVLSDGSEAPPRDPLGTEYVPCARPGHRLPHAWLTHAGDRVSTHDLLRTGAFLLLAGPEGQAWVDAAAGAAAGIGAELDAYRVGAEIGDEGRWGELCGHGPGGAVLVRPDGHVGFRAQGAAAEPERELEAALRTLLGHDAESLLAAAPVTKSKEED